MLATLVAGLRVHTFGVICVKLHCNNKLLCEGGILPLQMVLVVSFIARLVTTVI